MLAQAAVQPSVSVKETTQANTIRVTIKQVEPMMREVAKPAEAVVEQPRYDFVGIAG
ncbi:hypothetical protein [Amphritea sp. HPY]|uniref:hypothetical protein n=1 Tax=Amphritea sp. HPY TaxID=3421652 RepID=UPI003D7DFEFF